MRKAVVGITLFLLAAPLVADEKLNDRMMHSASILQEIRGPLEEEAPGVLENAYAVAVFPEFMKVGLLGGVKHGRGVLSTRLESGSWSRPAFVRITSGSFGLQFGVSMSQLLIVFKDPKAVEAISGGQFTIGADAGYAAGELGGSATAGTDNKLKNRIVMMARSKGLFAGVALEGGVLRTEKDSNVEFYNDAIGLDGRTLLEDEEVELPPVAQHFLIVLGESVPPVSPEAAPANHEGEGESDVDLRFAGNETAKIVAGSAPSGHSGTNASGGTGRGAASGTQNDLGANTAPEAGTWVTSASGNPQSSEGESSDPGLGSRIAGKLVNAALDGAKDLALDSIRDRPEVRGAKLAASAGVELASAVKPKLSVSAPLEKKIPLLDPEATIASTDGAWVSPDAPNAPDTPNMPGAPNFPGTPSAPDAPDHQVVGLTPDPLPSIPSVPDANLTGPPAPSEWPDEWRDAQILGGVCEPGT